jgi:hypothetical protein
MLRDAHRWPVAFPVLLLLLHAGAPTAAAQARAGGVHTPGSTAPREAPLLNWSEVTLHEFSFSSGNAWQVPLTQIVVTQFSLESVEGSQHWVGRRYHYDVSGNPVVDETWVYPAGTRMVEAVVGYTTHPPGIPGGGPPSFNPTLYPELKLAFLIPITSNATTARRPQRTNLPARVNARGSRPGPLAQALGYTPVSSAPARIARPQTCDASAPFAPRGPAFQAACVLLDPGQAVDLPNQIRIVRIGGNYRVVVSGSVVDDLQGVTIVRLGGGYYTLQPLGF